LCVLCIASGQLRPATVLSLSGSIRLLKRTISRRGLIRLAALGAATAALPVAAKKKRPIEIGHTGITWPNDVVQAITDTGNLGFYGFETFGDVLTKWESQGGLEASLEQHHLPLISGYCTLNLTDSTKRKDELDKALAWAALIKKYNGRIFVLGPNQVKRAEYDFASSKANIVSTLNEAAKAVSGQGLTVVLHQHTGTCVESRDETYAVLDAVDTQYVKFGPDIGQLTKGGSDAVQVVKDYLPLVQHMHLKDYNGVDPHLLGYCPLGQGKVNIPAILDMMAGRKIHGMVMGELDNDPKDPSLTAPVELVKTSKVYLESLGIAFRA
jgi:inosose dehydratase